MKSIRIDCIHDPCPNYTVIMSDDHIPHEWSCQACEDALLTLQLDELERRERDRKPWEPYGRTTNN